MGERLRAWAVGDNLSVGGRDGYTLAKPLTMEQPGVVTVTDGSDTFDVGIGKVINLSLGGKIRYARGGHIPGQRPKRRLDRRQ